MKRNTKFKIIITVLATFGIANSQTARLQMPKAIIDHKYIHDHFFLERGYTEIKLEKLRIGHYLVPVWIKGNKYLFLLDTGANGSGIMGAIADSLQLRKIKNAYAIGYQVDDRGFKNYLCYADSIKVGNFFIDSLKLFADNKSFRFAMNQLKNMKNNSNTIMVTPEQVQITSGDGMEYNGVIGDDFLSKYDAIIDLYSEKLYLRNIGEGIENAR